MNVSIRDFCNIEFDGSSAILERLASEINPDAEYSYIDVLCKDFDEKELAEIVANGGFPTDFDLVVSQIESSDLKRLFGPSATADEKLLASAAMRWAYFVALPPMAQKLAEIVLGDDDE